MTTALEVLRLLNSRVIKNMDELYRIADEFPDLELLDYIDAGKERLKKVPFEDAADCKEDDCKVPETATPVTPDDYLVLNALRHCLDVRKDRRTEDKIGEVLTCKVLRTWNVSPRVSSRTCPLERPCASGGVRRTGCYHRQWTPTCPTDSAATAVAPAGKIYTTIPTSELLPFHIR